MSTSVYPGCLYRGSLLSCMRQVLPKTLLHLNLSGNSLMTLTGLELPNLVWLDASSNQLQVKLDSCVGHNTTACWRVLRD